MAADDYLNPWFPYGHVLRGRTTAKFPEMKGVAACIVMSALP
jgi:hypothetical protein